MANRPGGDASTAVSVIGVTQRFSLRHEKTLKGLLVNLVQGRTSSETFLALDDVNLEVSAGSTTGLIGPNGSGKSTLLKIIGGVMTPTQGQVTRRGRLAALLELGAGFHRDLSGRENVYLNAEILGLPRSVIAKRFDEIVEFSGVEQFIDTPMKYYSSGMFVRLGFSVAIHTDPEILLVDEVLAVGDEQFQAKCLNVIRTMQNEGRTIVLVTHSMDSVMQFCDQAMMLHHGQVRAQGAPAEVIAAFRAVNAEAKNTTAIKGGAEVPSAPTPDAAVPRVVAVAGGTASGRPISQARTGDTLIIDATFHCPPGSAFVGRVELFHGGQLMVGTSTERLGLDLIRHEGEATYRFTLVEVPLAGGRYRVAVSTGADSVDRPQHTLPAAIEFSVPFDPATVGPVAVKAEVELLG